jgi:hypothetical protein
MTIATHQIPASSSEALLYHIQCAPTDFDLSLLTVQIANVAHPDSPDYWNLINASAERRMTLEQERLTSKN